LIVSVVDELDDMLLLPSLAGMTCGGEGQVSHGISVSEIPLLAEFLVFELQGFELLEAS